MALNIHMHWTHNGKDILELPNEVVGFVYQITNTTNGRMYIGKKLVIFAPKMIVFEVNNSIKCYVNFRSICYTDFTSNFNDLSTNYTSCFKINKKSMI